MNIIEFPEEEKINYILIDKQIKREEIKFYSKLIKREKLYFSYNFEKFDIHYNSFKIDYVTNLVKYNFDIHCKNFEDGLAQIIFDKYKDIIITDLLSDEQLIRKRKMQKEIQSLFNLKHRNTIYNFLLYNRFLFPLMAKRYWLKIFLNNFEMGYLGNEETNTPIVKIKGSIVLSIEHFMKDLKRMNFIKINKFPFRVENNDIYRNLELKLDFRLPRLFFAYSVDRIKALIIKFIENDFKVKGTQFTNFWGFAIKDAVQTDITQLQEAKWKDDTTIDIQYMVGSIDKVVKAKDLKKAAIALVGVVGADYVLNSIKKNITKNNRNEYVKKQWEKAMADKKKNEADRMKIARDKWNKNNR